MTPSPVSCPCGASLEVDLDVESQDIACPECGQTLEVITSEDPNTKRKRTGILVKAGAVTHRRGKPKLTPQGRVFEEVHTAKCVCGAHLTIVSGAIDQVHVCTACEAEYMASLKQMKTGLTTLVLRPVIAMPVAAPAAKPALRPAAKVPPPPPAPAKAAPRPPAPAARPAAPAAKSPAPPAARPAPAAARPAGAPAAAKAPPPPPPPKVAKAPVLPGAGTPAKEKMMVMAKGDLAAQEIVQGEKGARIICFCRAWHPLRGDYQHEIQKCTECGTAFRILTATHPMSGADIVIMIPRE